MTEAPAAELWQKEKSETPTVSSGNRTKSDRSACSRAMAERKVRNAEKLAASVVKRNHGKHAGRGLSSAVRENLTGSEKYGDI